LEKNESDFYHRLLTEITLVTRSKRSVIVFFSNTSALQKFVDNPVYRRLGRHKNTLTESTNSSDKEYIINKAATAGQITLSTAIFGRGTDFFCKDKAVEENGGVHVIQAFLSKDLSEEIQIQGRTARQGKHGSYQLVLLESDLERDFGVPHGELQIAHEARYDWLCSIRNKYQSNQATIMEDNLQRASEADRATRKYFGYLVAGDVAQAERSYQELYQKGYGAV
jgi:preprotein translocase subunit SecA